MTSLNTQTQWQVGKSSGNCAMCGAVLPAGTICWAALCERAPGAAPQVTEEPKKGEKTENKEPPSPFVRVDFCEACWGAGKRPADLAAETGLAGLYMISHWKTTVPEPQQKKKLLVDDAVLIDLFGRMQDRTEPQDVRFRFVLALILMRKRILKYEGMNKTDTSEVWQMRQRGTEKTVPVTNPQLTTEQIVEVSQQLSGILAEEI